MTVPIKRNLFSEILLMNFSRFGVVHGRYGRIYHENFVSAALLLELLI